MKLSSKGRYAVMAMADLSKTNLNQPTSLAEISLKTQAGESINLNRRLLDEGHAVEYFGGSRDGKG